MAMRTVLASANDIRAVWLDAELTSAEAAAKLGMHPDTLRRRANMLGLPERQTGRREVIRQKDEARFIAMWDAGVSARVIGQCFGCSYFATINTATRLGLKMRGHGYRPHMTLQQFEEHEVRLAMQAEAETAMKRIRRSWGDM